MENKDMPAMPQSGTEGMAGDLNSSHDWGGSGLTKLEHFAGLAMQGLIASIGQHDITDYSEIASDAVMASKSLLTQLEKESNNDK